jgi:iron only hydrogenase large subunit-like protein
VTSVCADSLWWFAFVLALQGLQDGSTKYDFIEVMACPGGCIGGGGQPRSADKGILAVSSAQ